MNYTIIVQHTYDTSESLSQAIKNSANSGSFTKDLQLNAAKFNAPSVINAVSNPNPTTINIELPTGQPTGQPTLKPSSYLAAIGVHQTFKSVSVSAFTSTNGTNALIATIANQTGVPTASVHIVVVYTGT